MFLSPNLSRRVIFLLATVINEHKQKSSVLHKVIQEIINLFISIFVFKLHESEFTSAASGQAWISVGLEIEILHIQMEDITNTKQMFSNKLCLSL